MVSGNLDSNLLKRHPFVKHAEEIHHCDRRNKVFYDMLVVYKNKFYKSVSSWYLDDSSGNSFQIYYCPFCGKDLEK